MDNIRIIFILPRSCNNESEASDAMIQAYEACKQAVANVAWVKESEQENIDLAKTDFVIFETFEGKNFEKLKTKKCARILGPWCVSICLMEGRPIPNYPWPIYNVAMDGCTVSCSHLPKKAKLELKDRIQSMGGCYTETLMLTNTHLITDCVGTEKYVLAAEKGLKLMTAEWVDAVWEASQIANVKADDAQFDKYKCLPFHKLTISATGVPTDERKVLANCISDNGGTFSGKLVIGRTDILICDGVAGSTSAKYKAARTSENLQCVALQWVYDCIEKGYALPCNLYPVKKSTSTPTKDNTLNPDFSIMSVIAGPHIEDKSTLEETVLNNGRMSAMNFSTPNKILNKRKGTPHKALDGIDIKKAKLAGQYLDGCSVYIAGFDYEDSEKLCKVLNLSGATRFDSISDRVTHVIVGDPCCHEVRIIKSRGYACSLVSVEWLLESMELLQPANEQKFLVNVDPAKSVVGSPLSKKGLTLLRSNKTITEDDASCVDIAPDNKGDDLEDVIMQQYLPARNQGTEEDTLARLLRDADSKFDSHHNRSLEVKSNNDPQPPGYRPSASNLKDQTISLQTETCTENDDATSQALDVFNGCKFVIMGFDEEHEGILKETIESALGTVLPTSCKETPHYAVVPVFNTTEPVVKATDIINILFINECLTEGAFQEILYYHRPFVIKDTSPLEGCVITISGYSNFERSYLNNLIRELGGEAQDQFARTTSLQKNVKACSHLVSMEASGKKYLAALKWKIPVVNKNWLLECAKIGKLVSEQEYSVGDSTAPRRIESMSSHLASTSSKSIAFCTPPQPAVSRSSASHQKENASPSANIAKIPDCETFFTPPQPVKSRSATTDKKGSPEVSSQVTPVSKIMEEIRVNKLMGSPQTPPMPRSWCDADTPETPLGAFITPNPSPNLRKQMLRYINQFPDFVPPKERRQSTPVSELKKRLWAKVLTGLGAESQQDDEERTENVKEGQDDQCSIHNHVQNDNIQNNVIPQPDFSDIEEHEGVRPLPQNDDTPEKISMQNKLQMLEDMLTASTEKKRQSRNFQTSMPPQALNPEMKDSQAFTVQWDYTGDEVEPKTSQRIFMLSGIDNETRAALVTQIEQLGGVASDLASYDPSCTHLVCSKPTRNEKTLACMAAGKWILHLSYIQKSVEAGKFLPEEGFEFGNEKSVHNVSLSCDRDTENRISAAHWWRKEIKRRGYGAFNDMRAIVVANKREPIIRVIEAGGGKVLNISPPFKKEVHATHCLLEPRSVADYSEYYPLAKQGIYCVNTLYINEFLHRTTKDIRDCILPFFTKFYS